MTPPTRRAEEPQSDEEEQPPDELADEEGIRHAPRDARTPKKFGGSSPAELWQQAFERAWARLRGEGADPEAQLWLHLGGLGLPRAVARPADLGFRFRVAQKQRGASVSSALQGHADLVDILEELDVRDQTGWRVREVGCSFFAHGPLAVYALQQEEAPRPGEAKREQARLAQVVVDPGVAPQVESLLAAPNVHPALSFSLLHGEAFAALRAEFSKRDLSASGGKAAASFRSLACSLAASSEQRLFDPMRLERLFQALEAGGGAVHLTGVECRAEASALLRLSVAPASWAD